MFKECNKSFIGKTTIPSIAEMQWYFSTTNTIYLVSGIFNGLLAFAVVVYVVVSLIRKHRLTLFQWTLLFLLFVVGVATMHNDTILQLKDNWVCSFINSIEQGCEYILVFQINFLVAWKLY